MGSPRLRAGAALAAFLILAGASAADDPTPPPAPKAEYPLSAYSTLGASMVVNARLAGLGWSDAQIAAFLDGMRLAFQGKVLPPDPAAQALAVETARKVSEARAAPPPPANGGGSFAKRAKAQYGLQVSTSGLGYNVTPGRTGVRPRPGDTVIFSCKVSGPDGAEIPFLSSDRVKSRLDDLIPGLREGLQMMVVGSQALFLLPPDLSFGQGPWPEGLAPGTPLVYRVVLADVEAAP